jgi:hypothetical protein
LKIEKKISLSKQARTTKKKFIYLFYFIFRVPPDAAQRPRGHLLFYPR